MANLHTDRILDLSFAYWESKVIDCAIRLELFTLLSKQAMTKEQITEQLQLHPRAVEDFLDSLVSMSLLERKDGCYSNSPESSEFLVKDKETYIGGIIELTGSRLYHTWDSLCDLLKTGKPQNPFNNEVDYFEQLYQDPKLLQTFAHAMTGLSHDAIKHIANKFDWKQYQTFCDLGGAEGGLPVGIVKSHPELTGYNFDLPPLKAISETYIEKHGCSDNVKFYAGDFFKDDLPPVDVYIYGHVLHGWGVETKQWFIQKAYDSLNPGGALIVYDSMIDDERRVNTYGLLMSLNLRLETAEGHDYTEQECMSWFNSAGFNNIQHAELARSISMVYGYKT